VAIVNAGTVVAAIEQSTRRRLYDAMKIMLAVGVCVRSEYRLARQGRSHIFPPLPTSNSSPREFPAFASHSQSLEIWPTSLLSIPSPPNLPTLPLHRGKYLVPSLIPLASCPLPFLTPVSPHRDIPDGGDDGDDSRSSYELEALDLSFYSSSRSVSPRLTKVADYYR
jgi:hypothetical protein